MNLVMGSNLFEDVEIPVLWGSRAIVQDKEGRISIIDLAGTQAELEVLGDEPAPGIEFRPTVDGFAVLRDGEVLYRYNPAEKILTGASLNLPEIQVGLYETRIGTNRFINNIVAGMAAGLAVGEDGSIAFGVGSLPPGLAKLIV